MHVSKPSRNVLEFLNKTVCLLFVYSNNIHSIIFVWYDRILPFLLSFRVGYRGLKLQFWNSVKFLVTNKLIHLLEIKDLSLLRTGECQIKSIHIKIV